MNTRLVGRSLVMVSALAALSCLCSCQSTSSMRADEEKAVKISEKLVADPDRRLADVPLPLGAHFNAGSSTSYETGSRRRVDHNYGIWAKKRLVRQFYEDNMPLYGWELTNSIIDQGAYHLSYRKRHESCRVSVGPTNWCLQTQIKIVIQPVSDFD